MAVPVTQQYLCGELASRVARLECAAVGRESCDAVRQLRRAAESSPPFALGGVARRALQLADVLCWDAVRRGDVSAFFEVAAVAADLHEFAMCARLLDE